MSRIVAICGVKNSGKTTLVSKLIRHLSGEGVKVAVIKHDGHDFACDIPGTDTYEFSANGAYGVACYSGNRMFVHRAGSGENFEQMTSMFPEADIILAEGLKDSTLPKIEVVREEVSRRAVSNPEGRFLIATDCPQYFPHERTAALDDINFIISEVKKRTGLSVV
ncbi:MAG: molybdopterin-guanine dinucleotide biosynthesis protein B [Mogibacterium sp.]|nr:molybdopterin-guanine dinucleotide biosynthesis protein B [Mogibacterium sp.]